MQKQPTKRTTSEIKIPPPPHPLHTPLILNIIYRKNRNEIFIIRQSKIFFISISRLLLLGSAKESLACLRFPMAWDSCEKDCSRGIKRERERGEKMLAKSIKICQKLKTLSFSLRRRVLYLFKQILVKTKHRTYGQRNLLQSHSILSTLCFRRQSWKCTTNCNAKFFHCTLTLAVGVNLAGAVVPKTFLSLVPWANIWTA